MSPPPLGTVEADRAQDARRPIGPPQDVRSDGCTHCGQPLDTGATDRFCCLGCKVVHGALLSAGLDRFYDLRGEPGVPVGDLGLERRDRGWLEVLQQQLTTGAQPQRLQLEVQGVRCAACVWVIEQLFSRHGAGGQIIVNPARGHIELTVSPEFPVARFVDDVEGVGYLLGPGRPDEVQTRDDLLMRAGVCTALALNTMLFSASMYFGLEQGPLFDFLRMLNFGMAGLAVLIGGPVFIGSAWQAMRRGVVHLDLPIAVAIVLTFAAACWSFITSNQAAAYHDSLAVFVALMLVGRYVQQRVVALNRDQLLSSDGVERLRVRRIEQTGPRVVTVAEIDEADRLLIPPGDLVPVDAALLSASATCSLDWINGESQPCDFARGDVISAGAFNVGMTAIEVTARQPFGDSPLPSLVRNPAASDAHPTASLLPTIVPLYVLGVLSTAVVGLAGWTWRTGELVRGLEVATAICVVSCPCALGIAVPLAHELAHAGLRRLGLFVRRADFLARCGDVRRVVFDKTGTLTTGRLRLRQPEGLGELNPEDRDALFNMTVRSLHPRSLAVRAALSGYAPSFDSGAHVEELPGRGLQLINARGTYQLGSASWLGAADTGTLVFQLDGQTLSTFDADEDLRHDARTELSQLRALGYETWLLSGDSPDRVRELAADVGMPDAQVHGGLSPQDKAEWIERIDARDTLMVGDGLNDALAIERAYCSGTPSIDRSFIPSRSDFYFVTPGIAPVVWALRLSRHLANVVRRNVAFAVVYNAGAIALALAGMVHPWVAALLMPASSLAVVGLTTASLSQGSRFWKS